MFDEKEKLKGDKKLPLLELIRRNLYYIKDEKRNFILAILFLFINVGLDLVMPLFMSEVTSELKQVDIRLYYIVMLAISYLLVGAINLVFLYVESMLLQNAGQRIVYRLRKEVFEHMNVFRFTCFDMSTDTLVPLIFKYSRVVTGFDDTAPPGSRTNSFNLFNPLTLRLVNGLS